VRALSELPKAASEPADGLVITRRTLLLGAGSMLLAGCASRQVRLDAVDTVAADQEASALALRGFRMRGRVALSDGEQGGNGRLTWEQSADRLDVRFSAPLSQRTWRLERDRLGARMIDDQGQVSHAGDLQELLDRAWGIGVPVDALSYWLRGSRQPGSGRVSLDQQARLQQLQQSDWTVDYLRWQEAADGLPTLPTKVYASSGKRWVRVVVQRWQGLDD